MADVLAVRDEYRAQQWAMVIQECSASGLSNREFCRQKGFTGCLVTDGYAGYNQVAKVTHFGCWAHMKRKW